MTEGPSGRPEEQPAPPSYHGYPPSYGAEPGFAVAFPTPTSPAYGAPPGTPDGERTAHPHPEPRNYALMLRTWDYRWWKPILGLFVILVGGFVIAPIVLLPLLAAGVAIEGGAGSFGHRFQSALSLDTVTPSAMLYLNLSLAALVLVAMAIERWVHRLRPRWLWSVKPGIRWRFLFACTGLAVVALIAQLVVGSLLPHDSDDLSLKPAHITGTLIAIAIVVLLTTPLQAMGEEFAFRGYLTQAFGSLTSGWFRDPRTSRRVGTSCAVVIPAVLFALAHGAQNAPLFLDRLAFGLLAGFLVVKVGGLEAGIALHILNNLLAFGVAIFFGNITDSLTVSQVSWWNIPLTITQNGVYLILVLLVAKRMGLTSTTSPPRALETGAGGLTGTPPLTGPGTAAPIGN